MEVTPTACAFGSGLLMVPEPDKYGLAALAVICSMRRLAAAILSATEASMVGFGGMAAGPGATVDADEVATGAEETGGVEEEALESSLFPEDEAVALPARRACMAALLAATRARMSSILYDGGFSFRARFASGWPEDDPSERRDMAYGCVW